MDLSLDPTLGLRYKSLPQKARVITESWGEANLFCPACPAESLNPLPPGTKVEDYRCGRCDARFQLKCKKGLFGPSVTNSAFRAKMEAVRDGRAPHYLFLSYANPEWVVTDLFAVPGYFFTPAVIQQRPPLHPNAHRSGWVGSKILLGALPMDARIPVVAQGKALPVEQVRGAWDRVAFLGDAVSAQGGWGADVLTCVRDLQHSTGSDDFSLQDFYRAFEGRLAALHPGNRNVRPKIRQQLQVLRHNGLVEFRDRGAYRVLK